ncbi:MAG: tetratricopeptide repeat protein, partial [Candidatus Methanoperedens sp.]
MKSDYLRPGDAIPDYKVGRLAALGLASEFVFDKKYDEAKEVLTKLLDLNLKDIEDMTLLANVHFIEGNNVEAEQLLDNALYLDPNHPQALYLFGSILHDNEEFDRA